MVKNIFSALILIFFIGNFASAQRRPIGSDSVSVYRDIESYSRRNKTTKFIFRLIFRPAVVPTTKKAEAVKVYKSLVKKTYKSYEGKIIRHIYIETLDPFGYSLTNSSVVPDQFLIKAGNRLHIKSQQRTIRNLLLIRENDVFDSLLVKESERLVRARNYVREVAFTIREDSPHGDSVDVYIRELDKWTIVPRVAYSKSRVNVQLNDRNFSGLGHEFRGASTWYHTTGNSAFSGGYNIPNIRNTYVNSAFSYATDEFRNDSKSISVNRPFFSPIAKWAGGASFNQQFRREEDSLKAIQSIKLNTHDYWAGNSVQIFRGKSENIRYTRFVSTVRLLQVRYLDRPDQTYDVKRTYSNEDFYLAGISISTRKYIQDKYVFNFGITEDVPVGKVYGLTGGYQVKNNTGRLYLGTRVSFGNYHPWGYMSTNYEYGTFFRASHPEQGVFTAGIIYFTALFELGKWRFRQFIKPQLTIGMNRFSFEKLSINEGSGIEGFNSTSLSGTDRIVLTLQTQSYAPINFIGFRFGPYLVFSMGMLADEITGFRNSRVYTQVGIGVLIKNLNLVFNTFQFSVSFYPLIPDIGQNVFKTNTFKTTDFGFRDFEIGRPGSMSFQ